MQIFALANTIASVLANLPSDGIMGWGFSAIATDGAPTFFENLISAGTVAHPYFSVYLERAKDSTTASSGQIAGGELCVGCIDSSKYTGNLNYVSVSQQGYWEVPMDGLVYNGNGVSGTNTQAAIDTGTTLVYVPTSVASAFYDKIGGKATGAAGQYSLPCTGSLVSIGLTFGGVTYEIPLEDINLGYVSASDTTQCTMGIIGLDQVDPNGNPVAIVGDLFLKAVYSTYSYSNNGSPAVGFAKSITSGISNTASASTGSTADNTTSSSAGYTPLGVAAVTTPPLASASKYSAPPTTSQSASSSGNVVAGFSISQFTSLDIVSQATSTSTATITETSTSATPASDASSAHDLTSATPTPAAAPYLSQSNSLLAGIFGTVSALLFFT
jgi:hypothetical protein